MKYYTILMFVAIFSCREIGGPNSPDQAAPLVDELTWVAILYVGGMQCDPSDSYTPPDVKHVLNGGGIPVYETTIEYYGVCAACGCPTYAAMHYAQISDKYLAQAEQLGFQQKDPPTS